MDHSGGAHLLGTLRISWTRPDPNGTQRVKGRRALLVGLPGAAPVAQPVAWGRARPPGPHPTAHRGGRMGWGAEGLLAAIPSTRESPRSGGNQPSPKKNNLRGFEKCYRVIYIFFHRIYKKGGSPGGWGKGGNPDPSPPVQNQRSRNAPRGRAGGWGGGPSHHSIVLRKISSTPQAPKEAFDLKIGNWGKVWKGKGPRK